MERPLLRHLQPNLPWCDLADLPSPVHPLPDALWSAAKQPQRLAFTKRDDLCSTVYAGNKVRALEPLLADARTQGAEVVYTAGASGSNHVLATALHAPRIGLRPRAVVFNQPPSANSTENFTRSCARAERVHRVVHWSLLPAALLLERHRVRHERPYFLPPGGANPLGVLGYVSAALELGEQVQQGIVPPPKTVVVGLGSGGTAAGLLLGFWLAARLRIGLTTPPLVVAVRVAPWPLASRAQAVQLALGAARLLTHLCKRSDLMPSAAELWRGLVVKGDQLGRGYGYPTSAGQQAVRLWRDVGLNELDVIYSAKVAAAFLRLKPEDSPSLFWSTKSSVPLPPLRP